MDHTLKCQRMQFPWCFYGTSEEVRTWGLVWWVGRGILWDDGKVMVVTLANLVVKSWV